MVGVIFGIVVALFGAAILTICIVKLVKNPGERADVRVSSNGKSAKVGSVGAWVFLVIGAAVLILGLVILIKSATA